MTPLSWSLAGDARASPARNVRSPMLVVGRTRSATGLSIVMRAHLGGPLLKDRAHCLHLVVLRVRLRHRMDEQICYPVVEDTTGYSRFSEDKQRNIEREQDSCFKLVPGRRELRGIVLANFGLERCAFFHAPAVASNWEKPRIRPPEQCFAKVSTSRSGKLVG